MAVHLQGWLGREILRNRRSGLHLNPLRQQWNLRGPGERPVRMLLHTWVLWKGLPAQGWALRDQWFSLPARRRLRG